ncbi:MAG: hypothetical protein CSYNP_00167 [Syntrophus sp. SKADARSKE-3]|nr:hypothetical protein [Syntrophus sp. SKADARSKE-3]
MVFAGWKNLFVAGFLSLTILFTIVEAHGAKWQFIGFTRYRDPLYLDLERTTILPNGVLSAWTRITPADNSLFRVQLRPELHRAHKTAKDVKYLEMNKEIQCTGNQIRHLKLIYYDHRDRVLAFSGNSKAPWKPILEGSLWPDLQKAVCRQKNK